MSVPGRARMHDELLAVPVAEQYLAVEIEGADHGVEETLRRRAAHDDIVRLPVRLELP